MPPPDSCQAIYDISTKGKNKILSCIAAKITMEAMISKHELEEGGDD